MEAVEECNEEKSRTTDLPCVVLVGLYCKYVKKPLLCVPVVSLSCIYCCGGVYVCIPSQSAQGRTKQQ